MPLPTPDLDDRRFDDLVAEAVRRLERACPAWTDRTPGDPGMALLELFAHVTEVMLYRLNRVPDKAYVEFLRLIGARLHPPAAAAVELRFARTVPGDGVITIPRGTLVAASGITPAPVFATVEAVQIAADALAASVRAVHADLVEGELAGTSSGRPGQWLHVARPPIIAASGDGLDLVVGVEQGADEQIDGPALRWEGVDYRVWREVESFAHPGADARVYVADRASGRITFAPAVARDGRAEALAEVPPAGRRIRVWYRRGGGPAGNVPAGVLTALRQPIPGIAVVNPAAAAGGRDGETLEQALVRGPTQFQSLSRAVTARDFEALALGASGGVARACAFTQAAQWVHAPRGTVEIILVPHLPAGATADAATLAAQQTDAVRERILAVCDERRPLGTRCEVTWARFKAARVQARVVIHREENPAAVRERVLARLREGISPLPSARFPGGWPFGRALRASHVYDIILAEPGVSYVDQVRLFQDDVPSLAVARLAADRFQPRTWYAAAAGGIYRSSNDVAGWELVGRLDGGEPCELCTSPRLPGLVAAITRSEAGCTVHVSRDCGESWSIAARTAFAVAGAAWLHREAQPILLLAASGGLFELPLAPGAVPVQVLVDPRDPTLGFYAVTVAEDPRGGVAVLAAARRQAGVYLSRLGGGTGTWGEPALVGEDVRCLCVQHDGPRRFLWAGVAAPGDGQGRGCLVRELRAAEADDAWTAVHQGWTGGSVRSLASDGDRIFAGTHRGGVLVLDSSSRLPAWHGPSRGASGLPQRRDEREGLQPVDSLAVAPQGGLVLAGGPAGTYASRDGAAWASCSDNASVDILTLPETWLFVSGAHDVHVVGDDAT